MQSSTPRPPAPPRVPRTVRLYPHQVVALALFGLIVLLALLGVFGESAAMTETRRGALAVRIDHPARLRFQQYAALRVRVGNTSNHPLDTVAVTFDTAYIDRFESVAFTPSPEEAYVVKLTDVPPGGTRLVDVALRANAYGRHRGFVSVTATGGDSVRVAFQTFVFP
ncbi:MAG TPA: hypothetical protein VLE53_15580 [Gemmatimonadaceae bacterium]|nr:hypothetical protein [Gemmatimonadaceae bacterium]